MDEDATWYGSRPPRRSHCIRRVPSASQKGHSTPPLLGPCLLWPRSPISATAELLLEIYYLWRYLQWITSSEGVKVRNSPVVRCYSGRATSNLTSLQQIGAWLKQRTRRTVIPRGHAHSQQPAACSLRRVEYSTTDHTLKCV